MRFIFNREFRDRAIVLLVFAMVMPLLGGCATLGIATSDELTATETRLKNSTRANTTRIDNAEKSNAEMQKTLTELTTSIDTLNTRFLRAKAWLETMNMDTIAADAQEASQLALSAEARSREFFVQYLEWLKSMQAALVKQIELLETKMKDGPAGTPKQPETTGDSGENDGASDDSDSG